jgi:hypothetical protein
VVLATGKADAGEQLPRAKGRAWVAPQLHWNLDVLLRRQRGDKLKSLENEADLLAPHPRALILVEGAELLTIQMHRARAGTVQAGQKSEQGCLTAARRTQDRKEPARLQTEGYILQHCEVPPARSIGAAQ